MKEDVETKYGLSKLTQKQIILDILMCNPSVPLLYRDSCYTCRVFTLFVSVMRVLALIEPSLVSVLSSSISNPHLTFFIYK